MSRRNSASRRRSYGRRLHEVRERRGTRRNGEDWLDDIDNGSEGGADYTTSGTRHDWLQSHDDREGSRG